MFEREFNVIKAFLKKMNQSWASEIDEVSAEHVITPFIQNDELAEIKKRKEANGGKAIESQLESIERFGYSDNAQETLEQIQKEDAQSAETRANAFNMSQQVAM